MTSDDLQPIRLREADQITLLALLLKVMDADLAREDEFDERYRARDAARCQLRMKRREVAPDNKRAQDELDIERDEICEGMLEQVESPAHALLLLASVMAYEPWAELDRAYSGRVDARGRRLVLVRACDFLPGPAGLTEVKELEHLIWPSPARRLREKMGPTEWFTTGALAAAGVATAGVAAPAIGAAIGGAMGLYGAAATSAGLAAVGGGAVASGGFGMAGGTAVIGALGGLGGASLGVAVALPGNGPQLESDVRVLRAFTHAALGLGGSCAVEAHRIEAALECEIAALLDRRARQTFAGDDALEETSAELERVVELRRYVSPRPFEVP